MPDTPIRVLCVEDEISFARATKEFLEQEADDLSVDIVPGPSQGLAYLREHDLDCIVSDYHFPENNGLELLERVRAEYQDVPFIVFTGKGTWDIAAEAVALGVTDYVHKGTGTDQYHILLDRIRAAVEGPTQTGVAGDSRIFDAIDQPILQLDREGTVVRVNDALAEVLGRDADDLRGTRLDDLFVSDDETTVVEELERVRETDGPNSTHFVGEYAESDDVYECRLVAPELQLDQQAQMTIIGTLRDVTEYRERTEELRQERNRFEEFVSVVSHDLTNPLNVAQARLNLYRETRDEEHLDVLDDSLGRMEEIIDELVTLAREGREIGEIERVSLREASRESWETVHTSDTAAELRCEFDADEYVYADRAQIFRVFENLFQNAVDHGGPDVTVEIGRLEDGFYVQDDGEGIDDDVDDANTLFEPGFTTANDGTGLGLAIVREVCEAHGWDVTPTDCPDGGLRFEIRNVRFESA